MLTSMIPVHVQSSVLSWFNDAACCSMRSQNDLGQFPPVPDERQRFDSPFPSTTGAPRFEPQLQGKSKQLTELASHLPLEFYGPDAFFLQIAEHCVNDPSIARRIEDDRTCPLIWGYAQSLRFQFLQMCIRDRYDHCREIWTKLSDLDRRDFVAVSKYGPPADDFFLNIMVNDELLWKELSDYESTASGSNVTHRSGDDWSSNTSESGRS